MPPTLSVTQLSTLAVLREMGYDAPRATAVLLKVGGSLNRALSALAEGHSLGFCLAKVQLKLLKTPK